MKGVSEVDDVSEVEDVSEAGDVLTEIEVDGGAGGADAKADRV